MVDATMCHVGMCVVLECRVSVNLPDGPSCNAHVCWLCMGVFDRATIYQHMNAKHGGIYDHPDDPLLHVDFEEQQELLRQAGRRRNFRRDIEPQR